MGWEYPHFDEPAFAVWLHEWDDDGPTAPAAVFLCREDAERFVTAKRLEEFNEDEQYRREHCPDRTVSDYLRDAFVLEVARPVVARRDRGPQRLAEHPQYRVAHQPVAAELREARQRVELRPVRARRERLQPLLETRLCRTERAGRGARDNPAVRAIMGHVDASIDAAYRERIEDARLRAVVDHVRKWLWPDPPS